MKPYTVVIIDIHITLFESIRVYLRIYQQYRRIMRVCGIKFIVSTPLKKSWKNLAPAASQSHGRSAQGVGAGRPPELRVEVLGFRV